MSRRNRSQPCTLCWAKMTKLSGGWSARFPSIRGIWTFSRFTVSSVHCAPIHVSLIFFGDLVSIPQRRSLGRKIREHEELLRRAERLARLHSSPRIPNALNHDCGVIWDQGCSPPLNIVNFSANNDGERSN